MLVREEERFVLVVELGKAFDCEMDCLKTSQY